MHLVLCYFHRILGPNVLISYPDVKLEEEVINRLTSFFDFNLDDPFFEIVLINKHKRILNLYFEVPSEWARGKREMVMVSLIMHEKFNSRSVYSFLVDAAHKIITTENVFKAFYKNDDFHDNDIEIDLCYEEVKTILFNSLKNLIYRLEAKS